MARTGTVRLGDGIRINDLINLGALTTRVPMAEVHQVLEETGRASERRRDLPAEVMVYYVIALALYRPEASREVLRVLLGGLQPQDFQQASACSCVQPLSAANRSHRL